MTSPGTDRDAVMESALELARVGRLYPSTVIHGGSQEERLGWVEQLTRVLLCERPSDERGCGECRHCKRLSLEAETFHPDFHVLHQDLRTSTSVDATKSLLKAAQLRPFEARGQVFVITAAETLSGAAANALLKNLEEPSESAPRNFFLLAPSASDLLPTLRSRSLELYLSERSRESDSELMEVVERLSVLLAGAGNRPSPLIWLEFARLLAGLGNFQELRKSEPWLRAAQATLELSRRSEAETYRSALLSLASDLLEGSRLRMRSIPAPRVLEGLVSRRLACRDLSFGTTSDQLLGSI